MPATPPPTANNAPVYAVWVLAATILGSSIANIDTTVVNVALPVMQTDLHAAASALQWVIEAYSLFLSALILVGGSLGDRLGRRKVFAAGIGIFAVASMACSLAPNIDFLIAFRAFQGIGGALLVPGSLAIITSCFDESTRGRAIGTWAGFSSITTAIGPVVGGWLVQHASWRWVFFMNVPLAALTIAIVFWQVPESRDWAIEGPLGWLGAVLVTVGLGAIVFGLIQADNLGLTAPLVLIALVLGIVALAAFVFNESRSPSPMMPLGIFRSPTFSGANLLTLFLYGALGGSLYFFPFDLQQVQGASATVAGAAFLPFPIIIFVLSRWTGGLVSRYGAKKPLIVGPVITAAGFALFAVPDIGGSYWTTFFPAVVVLSLGMSVVIAPLTTAVMSALSANVSGVASGVNNAVARAASLLAIAVLGLIVVTIFNSALDTHLADLHVSPRVRHAVIAQRSKLVGAPLPRHISPRLRAQLHRALQQSFVSGFRAAMLLAAFLALCSALFSVWLIDGKPARADS